MIVDDCQETLEVFQTFFTLQNYQVATACGGEECLEKVDIFKPDLILLDIMMPKMNGWEVLDALEKKRGSIKPKIVIFTVKGQFDDDIQRIIANPAYHYVHKPITGSELLLKIQEWTYHGTTS